MTQPTKPAVPDAPLRSQPSTFSTKLEASLVFWATFATYLDEIGTYTKEQADAALAAALAGDLPPLSNKALNFLRVNATETGGEFRSPDQVKDDIGLSQFSGRNLIINGTGRVNQRGVASGAAMSDASARNRFTLDRWYVNTVGQSLTFTGTNAGRIMTAPAGGVTQVIDKENVVGGTYCLNWTGTATATVNGAAQGKGSSFTLSTYVDVVVTLSGGTFRGVQVESGDDITFFEHFDYSLELARCQRYYEKGTLFAQGGYSGGAWALGALTSFANEKRIAPTVELTLTNSSGYVDGLSVQYALIDSVVCNANMSAGAGRYIYVDFVADSEIVA
jgi:hypothetical protein